MQLRRHEVPVAYSMVSLVQQLQRQRFHEFLCLWAAFNNIYATITDKSGSGPTLEMSDGRPTKTQTIGHVKVPKVSYPPERKQIQLAFKHFGDDLKNRLILHESTRFFVYRTPRWRGRPVETDAGGQHLNGVLNVGYTTCREHPVWSPIHTAAYERYVGGESTTALRDELAYQVLNAVYTVRNNLFHGGKRPDDANDVQVIEKALPLLEMIVYHFVKDAS